MGYTMMCPTYFILQGGVDTDGPACVFVKGRGRRRWRTHTSVTRKFMTSLFISSLDTLTCDSFASHASDEMVFLDAEGGMATSKADPTLACCLAAVL
jgi:hypothetical protein